VSSRPLVPSLVLTGLLVAGLSGCATGSAGESSSSTAAASAPESAAADEAGRVTISGVSPATAPVSGGTTVSITGASLDEVASVILAGETIPVKVGADGSKATFTVPAAVDYSPSTEALVVQDAQGEELHQADFSYEVTTPVDRQLTYALAHWSDYNTAEYETLGDNDCVNFTSQTLIERGWTQDDAWHYGESGVWSASDAWRSSTALMAYLGTRPDLATPLDDTQRDQVVPGDIAQFDWDGSGDRDHTGIVTRVEHTADGVKIYFAGHTLDSDYRDVDEAIMVDHPGGTAYYWHLS
jgi:hypothetical protein